MPGGSWSPRAAAGLLHLAGRFHAPDGERAPRHSTPHPGQPEQDAPAVGNHPKAPRGLGRKTESIEGPPILARDQRAHKIVSFSPQLRKAHHRADLSTTRGQFLMAVDKLAALPASSPLRLLASVDRMDCQRQACVAARIRGTSGRQATQLVRAGPPQPPVGTRQAHQQKEKERRLAKGQQVVEGCRDRQHRDAGRQRLS